MVAMENLRLSISKVVPVLNQAPSYEDVWRVEI
jgi:hypothetical protein